MAMARSIAMALLVALVHSEAAEIATKDFENINVDFFFQNAELMQGAYGCLLDKSPCTLPIFQKSREIIEGIIKTDCGKCSPVQKNLTKQFTNFTVKNYPSEWQQILDKYDTNKEHRKHFLEFAQSP